MKKRIKLDKKGFLKALKQCIAEVLRQVSDVADLEEIRALLKRARSHRQLEMAAKPKRKRMPKPRKPASAARGKKEKKTNKDVGRPILNEAAYAKRAEKNYQADQARKRKTRQGSFEESFVPITDDTPDPSDGGRGAEAVYANVDRNQPSPENIILWAALYALPYEARQLMIRFMDDNINVSEVAREYGVSRKAVYQVLWQLQELIKVAIEEAAARLLKE